MFRLLCMILGYAIGCIQSAYVVGRIMRVDLRKEGSGNLGTTNALRVLGKRAGLITFICDILKSVISFVLASLLFPEAGILAGLYGSAGAILGHDFPFYLKFKGGKGIATMVGLCLCLGVYYPLVPLISFGIAVVAILLTRYVSLGSLIFAVAMPIVLWRMSFPVEGVAVTSALAALALFQHRSNIPRIFSGTERKLGVRVHDKEA